MKPAQRALIVDDDEKIRYYLEVCLEDMGFACVSVATGERALNEIQRSSFDVLLLDVSLPGISGFEVLENVRVIDPDARVIMISGMDDPDLARHAIASLGADLFMTKPCSPSDLRDAINVVSQRGAVAS